MGKHRGLLFLLGSGLLTAALGTAATWTAQAAPPQTMQANEAAAIRTLRAIGQAQQALQRLAPIDCNADGRGEFGYLAELAGVIGLRDDEVGGIGSHRLRPPLLKSPVFGNVTFGTITHKGYMFALFLPNVVRNGVGEAVHGGSSGCCIDAAAAGRFWCCYAWPLVTGVTGTRTFYLGDANVLLECKCGIFGYSGFLMPPTASAAYLAGTTASMDCPIAADTLGTDTQSWFTVR